MIRIFILANSPARARSVAELLAEERQIEVLHAGTPASSRQADLSFVDVVVAAGLTPDQLPEGQTIVLLSDEIELSLPEQHIRARLPSDSSAAELTAAITAAASDLTVLTPAQAQRWLPARSISAPVEGRLLEPLTEREFQVLRMLGHGYGNKEIASQLGISDHTVKFHVAQILAKLGAASRTEAVAIALRRGLIPV